MKVVQHPRCPEHPDYRALVLSRPSRSRILLWTCSACRRTLGPASLSVTAHSVPKQGPRRLTVRDSRFNAKDWDWIDARTVRHFLARRDHSVTAAIARRSSAPQTTPDPRS